MKSSTPLYDRIGDRLVMQPTMEEPIVEDYWRFDGAGVRYFAKLMYAADSRNYREHVNSLPSFPCLEGATWHKEKGLVDGIDFETAIYCNLVPGFDGIYVRTNTRSERCKGCVRMAVPIAPKEEGERMFTLHEMKDCWVNGYGAGAWSEFGKNPYAMSNYFKDKFNIDLTKK